MKTTFALGITALLLGTSVHAADTGLLTAGSVGAGIGFRDCANTDDDSCGAHGAYDISGRISVPLGSSFSAQFDAGYEKYSNPDYKADQATKQTTYGLHASYRNPDHFLAGVFAGRSSGEVDDKTSGKIYGIEGQYYLDRFTFYAQAGKASIDNIPASDNTFKGRFYTLAARYFPTDDLMIQAGYAWGKSPDGYEDQGGGQWGKVKNYFMEGKMRVMNSVPLYGLVRFNHATYIANTEDDGNETSFMVGISYEFGAPTLYANDRRGATLTTSMMPGRAASWAEALD